MEGAWPGSSSHADTSPDDSQKDIIRVTAALEAVPPCQDGTRMSRDRSGDMYVFIAGDRGGSGSDSNKSGGAEGNRSSSGRTTDDDLHCVTEKGSAQTLRTELHHDISDGVSQSLQAYSERTSIVQQLATPVESTPGYVLNVPEQRDSRHEWDGWDSWVRATWLAGSGYIRNPYSRSVPTQPSPEQCQTEQVAQRSPDQSGPKPQSKNQEKRARSDAMVTSWWRVGGKPFQVGPTDSTRKGG